MADNAEIKNTCKKQEKKKHDVRTKKLHVCGIPKNATKFGLKKVLLPYGKVECKHINHIKPGVFAFVQFSNIEDAEKAVIASQNEKIMLSGKKLILSYNRTKKMLRKYKSNKKYKENLEKKLKIKAQEEEITGDAIIHILDDDCLSKIFKYLSLDKRIEIEDVCTRWKDVSEQSWHDIKTLTFPNPYDVDNAVENTQKPYFNKLIKRCGRFLTSLQLNTYCSSTLLSVRKYCYNLQKLQIEFVKVLPGHFNNAFSNMEKLEQFEIKNIDKKSTSDCLSSLPSTIQKIHMSMILTSTLNNAYKYLPRNSASVIKKFTALKELTLNGFMLKKNFITELSQIQTIDYLNLANCKFKNEGFLLLTNLVNLKYLNLEKVLDVYDAFLISLSKTCLSIQTLNLNRCTRISDKGLTELANLPNLEVLLLYQMPFLVTDIPFGRMRNLKTLECENSRGIRDPGIIKLIKVANNLSRLSLAGTSITNETIINAANITKTRKNNIKLNLCVDREVVDDYDKLENLSPLLVIEIRSKGYGGSNAINSIENDDYNFDDADDDDEYHDFYDYDNDDDDDGDDDDDDDIFDHLDFGDFESLDEWGLNYNFLV